MEQETDEMEGETDEIEGETDGERLKIVGVVYVMETTSAILNTSSSNGTVAPDGRFGGISNSNRFAALLIYYI